MNKVLECSTKGDKRFSAFCAYITINGRTDSIEHFYQESKKTKSGEIAGKGKPFSYFICPFCGLKFPAEDVSDLYKGLWVIYFNKHPELLEYASGFDVFHDMFKGISVNCQADVVREMVKDREAFVNNIKQGHWFTTMSNAIKDRTDVFRVIIAGSREFSDYDLMCRTMDKLLSDTSDKITIICGMARGADMLGKRYAIDRGYDIDCYPADWEKYGKCAGYRRNEEMAKHADALVAFWDGSSKGTEHMISTAKRYRLKIRIYRYDLSGENTNE